jgi:hypothetical protein
VAVLDWEFAVSSSPLVDLGHFLRYERDSRLIAEPYFSDGYLHVGGRLPQNWRQLARLLDLTALCESLTHNQLPVRLSMNWWNSSVELSRTAIRNYHDSTAR